MERNLLYIETERLIIRPYKIEDAEALKKAVDESLDELRPFMQWAKAEPSAIETKQELIKLWTKEIAEDKSYTIGIFLKNGTFVGSIGIHLLRSLGRKNFHIGYWISSKHSGNGYIKESSKALTDFGFNVLKAERMEIHCNEKNSKSAAVAKRLGYKQEGTFRILDKDENGQRIKHQAWYLFNEEWEKQRYVNTNS